MCIKEHAHCAKMTGLVLSWVELHWLDGYGAHSFVMSQLQLLLQVAAYNESTSLNEIL